MIDICRGVPPEHYYVRENLPDLNALKHLCVHFEDGEDERIPKPFLCLRHDFALSSKLHSITQPAFQSAPLFLLLQHLLGRNNMYKTNQYIADNSLDSQANPDSVVQSPKDIGDSVVQSLKDTGDISMITCTADVNQLPHCGADLSSETNQLELWGADLPSAYLKEDTIATEDSIARKHPVHLDAFIHDHCIEVNWQLILYHAIKDKILKNVPDPFGKTFSHVDAHSEQQATGIGLVHPNSDISLSHIASRIPQDKSIDMHFRFRYLGLPFQDLSLSLIHI